LRIPRFIIPGAVTGLDTALEVKNQEFAAVITSENPSHNSQSNNQSNDLTVAITGDDFNHLRNVLRLGVTDKVEIIFSDSGRSFLAEITQVENARAIAALQTELEAPELSALTLVVGICNPKTMDFIVEKSVELGVSKIVFYAGERSQEKLGKEKAEKKALSRSERFSRIAKAALKQSGFGTEPEITFEENLLGALSNLHSQQAPKADLELRLIGLAPSPLDKQLKNKDISNRQSGLTALTFRDYALENIKKNVDSYIVIGPEGGLADNELRQAEQFFYRGLSLGSKTLRTETAVIAACAILRTLN